MSSSGPKNNDPPISLSTCELKRSSEGDEMVFKVSENELSHVLWLIVERTAAQRRSRRNRERAIVESLDVYLSDAPWHYK